MDHNLNRRPRCGALAAVAAAAVMLATTTPLPPKPPTELTVPRISTEAVQLTVLPELLTPAPASINRVDGGAHQIPNPIDVVNTIGRAIAAGIGAGVIAGFVVGGILALNVVNRIPVLGPALTPVVQIVAIAGAIVGAPIGAVVGALSLLRPPPSIGPSAASSKASAASPHRVTQPRSRSNRQNTKPSAPGVTKGPVRQQGSGSVRTSTGHARNAATSGVRRH